MVKIVGVLNVVLLDGGIEMTQWDVLKKNDVVGYWNGQKECRGRAIGVELTNEGTIVYIENLDTHMMDKKEYSLLTKLHKLDDFDRECMMPIKEFIIYVKNGSITDYDGSGYYSDGEYRYGYVDFHPGILKDKAKKYKYVCWYNK